MIIDMMIDMIIDMIIDDSQPQSGTSIHVCAKPSACLSLVKSQPWELPQKLCQKLCQISAGFLNLRPTGVYVVQPHIKDRNREIIEIKG